MELLSRAGSAPIWGSIEKVGPTKKAGYDIEAEGVAVEHADVVNAICSQTVMAIQQKKEKTYPPDTWLIVAFDDAPPFRQPDYEQAVEAATETARDSQFSRVYLVGSLEKRFCRQVWPGVGAVR